jgi:ribonuclease P protein component
MLASNYRLKKPRDITRVFKRGRYGGSGAIQVKTAPNSIEHSRLVIVVSKKVSKKAVVRNRLRRRVSGVVEQLWATVIPGYDIVITVREDVSALDTKSLADEVATALSRARLLSKETSS